MGMHGDGKSGSEGDKKQSPRDSDGQWKGKVANPPTKKPKEK
ncbi:hypothetical protein [Streptomyces corynorhini]|nr:hypothetical protein [Streptomyces corynorhini]